VTRRGTRTPAAFILLILLVAAPAAGAQSPVLPEEFSAADQYVESVPTSAGPRPARDAKSKRTGQAKVAPAPIPPAVDDLGGTLKEVATSPRLGAPDRGLPDAQVKDPGVPSAAVSSIDNADGGRLLWLLLALLAVSGAIAGTATYRHRARRKATDT
jgi:hypothetical protein